jgi:RNA polymerase sigma factor (sigma-70 family)
MDDVGVARLVRDNDGLARAYAKRYFSRHDYADILQSARIGLVKAAQKYDPSRDVAFSTFAYIYIHGAIIDYFHCDSHLISYPSHVQKNGVVDVEGAARIVASLDDLEYEGNWLRDNSSFENKLLSRICLEEVLSALKPRERRLINMLAMGDNQADIARKMRISRTRVGQLLERIREKIGVPIF